MKGGAAAALAATIWAGMAHAEEVGEVTTAIKILGANHRIVVEAFDDPKVEGIACFMSRARTGGISGSLGIAEDTSDASLNCQQTGAVKFREELEDGEEVFSRRASIMFKRIQVVRFFDESTKCSRLSDLFGQADRRLAEEQRLGRGDSRLAVTGAGSIRTADHACRRRTGRSRAARRGAGNRTRGGGGRRRRRRDPPGRAAVPGRDRRHGLAGRSARLAAAGVPMHPILEQDTTDLEKCLYSVAAPLFIGLGFLGGRIDHHLAAMNALVRFAETPVVLVGGEDLCFLCPPRFEIALAPGTRVSLFPMGPVRGRPSDGLRWPVSGLAFDPTGRIGTSNEATGGLVRIGFDAPRMLVILPAGLLGPVVDRLRGA